MAGQVLVVELAVELLVDFQRGSVGGSEDVRELCARGLLGLLAFLGQAFNAEDLGGREGAGPFGEVDVVLKVWGYEVGDLAAEGVDGAANFRGKSCWGDDGESAGLEADCCWVLLVSA